ncbi:MAG TPA: PAS domain-containing sensor histidine kinase [Bacteroidales bacterium]|nr:PAS domain-containing sensor histidine kinase [Bacteroidales bacterium]
MPENTISEFIKFIKHLSFERQVAIQVILILSLAIFLSAALNTFIGLTILTYFFLGLAMITAVRTVIRNYRETKEKAEQSETKFSTLFSLSPDPVFIVEKNSGRIIDINEKAAKTYGYSREELIGMPNILVSAEPAKTKLATEFPQSHIPVRYHRKKNGEVFPAEITSAVIMLGGDEIIIANIRDISERKNHEQSLEKSETRLKLAVESANAGIWELDYPSRIIDYNNFYYQMLGYEITDISNNFDDLVRYIHPDDLRKLRMEVFNLASHPEQMFHCQVRCLTKEGSWKWVMTYGKVSLDGNGQISKVTGINIDIDQLMNMQAALEKANADKNLFLSILAHDLRGPFSSLLGFSDLLLRNIDKYDHSKILTQLSYINEISHNTYNLLEDLLLWSCSQSGSLKFEPVNVNLRNVFSGIIKSMEPAAFNKKITLRYSAGGNETVKADPEMLNTILRNLISNSVKFTPEGGEISISAQTTGKSTIISIADNGVGISEDDQHKLWNISKVFTLRGTNGEAGTGLGLILCKDFVRKHGGKIWVESTPGKGSRFNFTLS